jgi:predicted ATPase
MIRRIEALNYRSLRYVSQEIRPFQILVGPNATGKSTFLDVPALLGDFLRDGIDDTVLFGSNGHGRASRVEELFFNQQGNHFELAIELTLPESVRASPEIDTARYEIQCGHTPEGELTVQSEILSIFDYRKRFPNLGVISQGELFPKNITPPAHLRQKNRSSDERIVVRRSEEGNNSFNSENSTWKYNFKTSPRRAALASVPEDNEKFPSTLWVRNFLQEGIRTLALNGLAMRRPVSPSASREFQVDGSNLPLVVRELKKTNPDYFIRWVEHLKTILMGLKNIEVIERSEDRHLYIVISYEGLNQSVPSWLVSDGTLRVLALTLIAYLDEKDRIYLIEEPENGIHPRAIEGVFESLSSVYDGQVLVATHSPLLLKLASQAQLLCFAKTEEGATDVVSGDAHPALRHWQGKVDLNTLYVAGVLG